MNRTIPVEFWKYPLAYCRYTSSFRKQANRSLLLLKRRQFGSTAESSTRWDLPNISFILYFSAENETSCSYQFNVNFVFFIIVVDAWSLLSSGGGWSLSCRRQPHCLLPCLLFSLLLKLEFDMLLAKLHGD